MLRSGHTVLFGWRHANLLEALLLAALSGTDARGAGPERRTPIARDPYVSSRAYLQAMRAERFSARGEIEATAEALRLGLVYDPGSAHLALALARALFLVLDGTEGAQPGAELERAVSRATLLAPDRAEAWRLLGLVHRARGRLDEAERAFRRAVSLEPASSEGFSATLDLAELLQGAGSRDALHTLLDLARATLERRLAAAPKDPHALAAIAAIDLGTGDFDRALGRREAAAKLAAEDPSIQEALGDARRAAGDRDEADVAYARAAELLTIHLGTRFPGSRAALARIAQKRAR